MAKKKGIEECFVPDTIKPSRNIRKNTISAVVPYISYENWLCVVLGIIPREKSSSEEEDNVEEQEEKEDFSQYQFQDDIYFLRSLDPKEWKEQDHYAVLGIKDLRNRATEDVIKRAYKYKILKHHPDKRKAQGEDIRTDDDYFTCITRAWETLGNPLRRKSYDSVDPYFDDSLPDEREARDNFYETMAKAFEDNSRWSIKRPVPKLGRPDTSRSKVERFYSFWYNFESWREYSYEDEEDKESGQDRDMRKWIEKKNKAVRAKRKKEEMTRIRSMVDMAYNSDPRIKKFQQDDRDKKTAKKRERQEAARAKQLEEEKAAREVAEKERLEREKRELEERARNEIIKQERELRKKALRKERKTFRELCKEKSYFADNSDDSLRHMESVEKICEMFELARLEDSIQRVRASGKSAFLSLVNELDSKLEEERKAVKAPTPNISVEARNDKRSKQTCQVPWSESEIRLLVKAVNLFPAGTNQRWEVVANFINQHSESSRADHRLKRDAKEVLAKAKDLQSTDFSKSSLKEQANKQAFDNFIAEKKTTKDTVEERMPAMTERLDPPATNGLGEVKEKCPVAWTPAEQSLLEQALKTYPTTVADRWDQIAACIPTRSKKECMRRYKELVEIVKAKKAARILN